MPLKVTNPCSWWWVWIQYYHWLNGKFEQCLGREVDIWCEPTKYKGYSHECVVKYLFLKYYLWHERCMLHPLLNKLCMYLKNFNPCLDFYFSMWLLWFFITNSGCGVSIILIIAIYKRKALICIWKWWKQHIVTPRSWDWCLVS
jgi:hypothetical protein